MDTATVISLAISIAAFILSSIALWQTHFAKFKLVNAVGDLQIRIYPRHYKKEKWYLPTINAPISLTNVGARAGKVLGLRILACFPGLPTPNDYRILDPSCEIDYKKFEAAINQNSEWVDEAVLGDWMPFIILPKQTVTKHLVFQSRWDEMIIQDNALFELEIFTNVARKWQKIAYWEGTLSPEMWDNSEKDVSSFVFIEKNTEILYQKEKY